MINKSEKEIMKNWKVDPSQPLVSICCITYNHEKYIEEALDSFLMQEIDFPFEIVIDDDSSTDKTPDIICQYIENYPNIIRANLRKKNVGSMTNFIENIKRARGKYIALCEGDDYWIDSYKLKKQSDFLEKNKEYVMVGGNVLQLDMSDPSRLKLTRNLSEKEKDLSIYDYIQAQQIPSATLMFKKECFKQLPNFCKNLYMGDWCLSILLLQNGKAKYFNEFCAIYRRHSSGLSKKFSGTIRNKINNTIQEIYFLENWSNIIKIDVKERTDYLYSKLSLFYLKTFNIRKALDAVKNIGNVPQLSSKNNFAIKILSIISKVKK